MEQEVESVPRSSYVLDLDLKKIEKNQRSNFEFIRKMGLEFSITSGLHVGSLMGPLRLTFDQDSHDQAPYPVIIYTFIHHSISKKIEG